MPAQTPQLVPQIVPQVNPQLIQVHGLPAHPLIVHAAVVFGPLAVLAAVGYVIGFWKPTWREYLRWPLVVLAVLAFVSIWAAYLTGDNFRESSSFFEKDPLVEHHADLANVLRWITTAFAIVAVALAGFLHRRTGAIRLVGGGALGVLAVLTLVWVVLTGDAGAKAVWGSGDGDSSAPASVSTVAGHAPRSPMGAGQ